MILSAHQPVYLPWLGLFHKIALADKFIFFDQVQYVPKDWISRNQIRTYDASLMLTVPVLKKGHRQKKIAEIEINNALSWGRKHWRSIEISYRKAPFFKLYSDFFEDVYNKEWRLLADLNYYMLKWYLMTLGINIEIDRAGNYDFTGNKSELVLDMCLNLEADIYIFGELGKDYANSDAFLKKEIIPYFQSYKHPTYRQIHGDFLPYMSIIDLLFNEGPNSLEIIMSENVTKIDIIHLKGDRINL